MIEGASRPPLAFHVLAVSSRRVRLIEGTREGFHRVDLGDVPIGFEEALGELQHDAGVQQHSSTSSRLGRRPAIVHGHGGGAEHHEADLASYFRTVARALAHHLGRRTTPLVLASVQEHVPLLRAADLPWIVLDEGIAGNPDNVPDRELHAKALPIVEAWARHDLEEVLARFGDLAAHDKASDEVSTILEAAFAGRVQTLLVRAGSQLWGLFDPATPSLTVHRNREPGDQDLVAAAVRETLEHRGTVWEASAGDLPAGVAMAAIFRY